VFVGSPHGGTGNGRHLYRRLQRIPISRTQSELLARDVTSVVLQLEVGSALNYARRAWTTNAFSAGD
jgi:hypothetical protein